MSNSPKRRLTLAEMAAAAHGDAWSCPRCGCHDWRVADSRLVGGTRRRQRVCRNRSCGALIYTQELPVPNGHRAIVVRNDPPVGQ